MSDDGHRIPDGSKKRAMSSIYQALSRGLKRLLAPPILDAIRPEWPKKKFLRDLLHRQGADCELDVGANEGQYAAELRTLGFTGQIVSFEPDPQVFAQLQEASARDDKWAVLNEALGSTEGKLSLNVMAHSVFNSFRDPVANPALGFDYGNRVVDVIEVPVHRLDSRLDDLSAEYRFSRPYLKIDTQGWDLEVLRGTKHAWPQLVGLQCEASVDALYEGVPNLHESIETCRRAGFHLAGVFPVHPGAPRVSELDCFFTKTQVGGT